MANADRQLKGVVTQAADSPLVPTPHIAECARPLSMASLGAGSSDPAFRIVDVRAAHDFQGLHIEGAVNLPLNQIRSSAFLGTAALVLMGGDGDVADLRSVCSQLRAERGQSVFVEPEGVSASWASARLTGTRAKQPMLAGLSPPEYFRARSAFQWAALILSDEDTKLSGFVDDRRLSPSASPQEVGVAIKTMLKAADRVLLIDGGDVGPNVLSGYIADDAGRVRLLVGGLSAYRQYTAMNRALHENRTAAPSNLTCGAKR